MDIHMKPVANPMLVLREEFDDWAILFDPDTGDAYGLNPVGVDIFKHLDGNHTIREIMERLHRECEDIPETADAEVTLFIESVIDKGYAK